MISFILSIGAVLQRSQNFATVPNPRLSWRNNSNVPVSFLLLPFYEKLTAVHIAASSNKSYTLSLQLNFHKGRLNVAEDEWVGHK